MKIKLIIIILSLFIIAGCTSSEENIQPSSDSLEVSISNFAFLPDELTVNTGDTVTWINNDNALHTATGDGFNSGTLNQNQEFQYTFSAPGAYEYKCNFHSSMKGKITVISS